MIAQSHIRAALLRTCAPAALAASAIVLPQAAQAQGFQADSSVVQGNVTIDSSVPGVDTITIIGNDAVIDWTPNIVSGPQIDIFLPQGNEVHYRGGPDEPGFAVLNRVLAQAPGFVEFHGLVDAFLTNANNGPTTPGGMVVFWAPNGILVGPTGRFEVPQLVLTTQEPTIASFTGFAAGTGPLTLSDSMSVGTIIVDPGAVFESTPEDSFVVLAAPQITMGGTATVNGSVAYVAGTQMTLRHNSGLFDITVAETNFEGPAIVHTGSTGGPSSTGAGDEHVIYAVARSGNFTLGSAMLFSGNLGFQPASVASVVNGDIILSANYDVAGRTVDGGANRQGISSVFAGRANVPSQSLDIDIRDVNATSNVLAIGSDNVLVGGTNNFDSDLVLVGRGSAAVTSQNDESTQIAGDLFVSAQSYRSFVAGGGALNAVGGNAGIYAGPAGIVSVEGDTLVTADAIAWGLNAAGPIIGSATAGHAQVLAQEGIIDLQGNVTVRANALTDAVGVFNVSGLMSAGIAELYANDGGELTVGGDPALEAIAIAPLLSGSGATQGSRAEGGFAYAGIAPGGGTLTVDGVLMADASARGGNITTDSGAGGAAIGGIAEVSSVGNGLLTLRDAVLVVSDAQGGNTTGTAITAIGGDAFLGSATVFLLDSTGTIGGQLGLRSSAVAGNGRTGGVASYLSDPSHSTVLSLNTSQLTVAQQITMTEQVVGGAGTSGTGGNATGLGLTIDVRANSTLTAQSTTDLDGITIGGFSTSAAAGQANAAQAQVRFEDLSTGVLRGDVRISLQTDGGGTNTGTAGSVNANQAGNASLELLSGSTAAVTGDLKLSASGRGGLGNGSGSTGGNGFGGQATINVSGAQSLLDVVGNVELNAVGIGQQNGSGTGGTATIDVENSGSFESGLSTTLVAQGRGGTSTDTRDGGDGLGGEARLRVDNTLATVGGITTIDANGLGGNGANGGNGTGGLAELLLDAGDFTSEGDLRLFGVGIGGNASDNGTGGSGFGGDVTATIIGASEFIVEDNTAISAGGRGGNSDNGMSGAGEGADAVLTIGDTATANLFGILNIDAIGTAGNASGIGASGTATGGFASLGSTTSGTVQLGSLTMAAGAFAPSGSSGGQATAGEAIITLERTPFTSGATLIDVNAQSERGDALAGTFDFSLANNANADIASLDVFASGQSARADGAGGFASIRLLGSSGVALDVPLLDMELSALGAPEGGATAGNFLISALAGEITTNTATIVAAGNRANTSPSQFVAQTGTIRVNTLLDVTQRGGLRLTTGTGGAIVGGASVTSPGATFDLTATGLVEFLGDSATVPGVAANTVAITSNDIAIASQAVVKAGNTMTLTSLNTTRMAVIGGTANTPGYSLTQAEANQLRTRNLTINLPSRTGQPASGELTDAQLGTLTLTSAPDSTFANVDITTTGSLEVAGRVALANAVNENRLSVSAGDFIQFTLPTGSLNVTNANGGIDGDSSIQVSASSILAAGPTLATLIRTTPLDPTIPDLLADDGGASEVTHYLAAGDVTLRASNYILMQNTGSNGVLGGVLTVGRPMQIINSGVSAATPLNVIAYGLQQAIDGAVTNNAYFDDAIAGTSLTGPFSDEATLNNCVINDGSCPITPNRPHFDGEVTNGVTYQEPLVPDDSDLSLAAEDLFFGTEFPSLVDTPLISQDDMVGDPVTSGADNLDASDAAEDENDAR